MTNCDQGLFPWESSDFDDVKEDIDENSIWRVTNHFAEAGLLESRGLRGNKSQLLGGHLEINGAGVDVIEGWPLRQSQSTSTKAKTSTYRIHGISGWQSQYAELSKCRSSQLSSRLTRRMELPSKSGKPRVGLQTFLEHPLVTSMAGGLISVLKGA